MHTCRQSHTSLNHSLCSGISGDLPELHSMTCAWRPIINTSSHCAEWTNLHDCKLP